ncbi:MULTISPECIES: bactofilin family protein [Sphingomonas]|uniref:bactofilin family protein n=1 Tax=Sphingomonas TaxID=13687 RepID=UPI0009E71F4E|nr:polymer-forming cytoskeletal protein [Sphingomonas sp. CCH10-B3]
MFNNKTGRDTGTVPAPPAPPAATGNGKRGMFSVLGADVTITGNIRATADLHIDGHVEGDVDAASVVQGAESRIIGNVRAETARLTGTIDGKVVVRHLVIERTAKINGDIDYETITIENGASLDGHLRHKSPGTLKIGEPEPVVVTKAAEQLLIQGEVAA